ncbi:MAG: TatD family hydrolase [Treponema sp.]|nr:TatD family hydrolase [Treponema sp.]
MLVDAHCHPYDLARAFPEAENERRHLGVLAAASACGEEEFSHNETLARNARRDNAVSLLPCFAVHPQQFAVNKKQLSRNSGHLIMLDKLASEGRIKAVGECGFDLFNAAFRETETLQDDSFAAHLEIALRYDLPVILHVRRAMHKIFSVINILSRCKAVIFHSWPGTSEEGRALLQRGVNAYFSFGNIIRLNHKHAIRSCALLPVQRLLTETDAPYQPPRGENYSRWSNLPLILEAASVIRNEAGAGIQANELETQIENNFRAIFKCE